MIKNKWENNNEMIEYAIDLTKDLAKNLKEIMYLNFSLKTTRTGNSLVNIFKISIESISQSSIRFPVISD